MPISFLKILSAPIGRLLELAVLQCSRRKVPRLRVARTLPIETKMKALADWLDALHQRDVFNGAVLIALHGKVQFDKHYGFADAGGAVPLTDRSSFSLASVSKPFTGMGIMLLAQQGKLTLDDKLAQHIPELAGYGTVTIRQLLHHTSGMPDYVQLADEHWNTTRVLTTADLIALFQKLRSRPNFAPGEGFEYSNTGYVLLGEIITRASGQSFPEFMTAEIFKPLGMNDSAAFNLVSKECPLASRAFGLRKRFVCFGKKRDCDMNYLDGVFGDGGIYASPADLVRWDAALRDGTLIPSDVYEEAYVSGELNDGDTTGYGFGWEIHTPNVVGHWGEWEGFTSYLRRDLKRETLLVVLSNLGPSISVDAISAEIAALVERI
jgi:CubicO group peptidase (beta-lactamase class C family)